MLLSRAASGSEPFGPPDWTSLGLVLALVGCFLLANGILFRNPRSMIAERLGGAPQRLRHLREFVFHRVQMGLGFLFLLGGFSAQLYGNYAPATVANADRTGTASSPVMWIGLVVVLAVVLEVVGWWWSVQSLRRSVRRFLRENPPDFETDPNLAREIGELYGIATRAEETVQSYAARLRAELGLALAPRASRVRPDEGPRYATQGTYGEESDPGFDET
jgi:hypothetical protein